MVDGCRRPRPRPRPPPPPPPTTTTPAPQCTSRDYVDGKIPCLILSVERRFAGYFHREHIDGGLLINKCAWNRICNSGGCSTAILPQHNWTTRCWRLGFDDEASCCPKWRCCYGTLRESSQTISTLDGIPLVCGGASEEAAVGCSAFYPGSGSEPGEWIPRGDHDWSLMPWVDISSHLNGQDWINTVSMSQTIGCLRL